MAATNHEKQKKGPLMSLYKAATASPRHRSQLPESNPPPQDSHHQVDIKSYISRGWLFRKSKVVRSATTYQGNDHGQVAVLENNIIIEPEKAKADGGGGGGRHGGGGGGGGGEKVGHVMIEGRKSVSHVETNLGSVVAFLQVKVLVSDMPNYMQVHAFRCARRTYDSLEKFSARHMAYNIKKEFDKVHGPAWHCIVGSSFGSFVTHSTGCFLYFSMDQKLYILLFKTKIQKAPH